MDQSAVEAQAAAEVQAPAATLPIGTHIGLGGTVWIADLALRQRAGLSLLESQSPLVDLMATVVPPSLAELAFIAAALVERPSVRLYAVRVSSFSRDKLMVRPICDRMIAESSCFLDDGPDLLEEDLDDPNFEVTADLIWASEAYYGSALPGIVTQ